MQRAVDATLDADSVCACAYLRIEHLLGELRHGERAVLLRAARGQRGEADHEEVQTREGDQVDGELAEIAVELACERGTEAQRAHREHTDRK